MKQHQNSRAAGFAQNRTAQGGPSGVDRDPKAGRRPDFWREQGRRALQSGDVREALWYLRRAIETRSEHPTAWHLLGRCFEQIGQEERARRCYSLAVRQALKLGLDEEAFHAGPLSFMWNAEEDSDT